MITGKDLIGMGYKPNKLFKDAIEHINAEMHIEHRLYNMIKRNKITRISMNAGFKIAYQAVKIENENQTSIF